MSARPDGFQLVFTQPVDRATAAAVESGGPSPAEEPALRLIAAEGTPEPVLGPASSTPGALDTLDVRDFGTLPADLQAESGALSMSYQSAMLAGGTYEDGTIRTPGRGRAVPS